MPCIYFLVFLLALLPPLSTLTTADAEQYGGTAQLSDRASTGRFCLRGPRSKFQNHPPQPTEKYLEKTSSIDGSDEETIEPEEMSEDDEEGNPTAGKVAVKKSKEIRFEDKASDLVKVNEEKKDEANKYKTVAAAAAAPSKAKGSNSDDFEDIN